MITRTLTRLETVRRPEPGPLIALVAMMVVASAVILAKGRGLTFSYDEWDWIVGRIPWRTDVLLTPHNGHLSLVPLLIFKVLFVTVGLKAYWVYRCCWSRFT